MQLNIINISYSSYRLFLKCPYAYYLLQVEGIQPKPSFLPISMLRGKVIHEILFKNQFKSFEYLTAEEQSKVKGIYRGLKELEIVDYISLYQTEVKNKIKLYQNSSWILFLSGIVDGINQEQVIELKYTSRSREYIDNFEIQAQLAIYSILFPSVEMFHVIPLQVPELKIKNDESLEQYENRVYQDVLRRPAFYLPNFKKENNKTKFGLYIYSYELENYKNSIIHDLKIVFETIKLMHSKKHFPKSYNNCHDCGYRFVCETGTISDEIYEKIKKEEEL